MITGQKIKLRPPLDKDHAVLFEMRNNIKLQEQLMSVPRPSSIARVRQWLERKLDDERALFFIIEELIEGNACGFVQIVDISFIHRTGKLGVALSEETQGRGFGKEAISLIENYAKKLYQLRKIELRVLAENKHAISLYTRMGYRSVGILEEHFYSSSVFHDVLVMEKMLREQTTPETMISGNGEIK